MNEIDKWYAEQCGVEIETDRYGYPHWYLNLVRHDGLWTIKDPRCREIVRERFKIMTFRNTLLDCWETVPRGTDIRTYGKTIAEAEIACITAIYEARDDI